MEKFDAGHSLGLKEIQHGLHKVVFGNPYQSP